MSYFYHSDRYVCTVLEEMRKMDQTKNYAGLLGAIEEAQAMVNRMESGLEQAKGIKEIEKKYREKKKELKKLEQELDSLKEKVDDLKDELGEGTGDGGS